MNSKIEKSDEVIRSKDKATALIADAWSRNLDYEWYLSVCQELSVSPVQKEIFDKLYVVCQEGYNESMLQNCMSLINPKASDLFF